MTIFIELSIIIVVATVAALLMRLLRQPLIVGYILTGIVVGPYALDLLHSKEEMELFSKIGISILLFIVGLTLNPDIVREVGKTSLITGIGQVLFTSSIGFFIVYALGFGVTASLYVAIALTFSSTIIILKLLSDRGDTGKLYGKISIGFLLVQDLVATLILLFITVFGSALFVGQHLFTGAAALEILRLLFLGSIVTFILYGVSKFVLPKLSASVAGNPEVLFIFSIAWGLGLSSLFAVIGFSIEIGALIAGTLLAVSPFAYEIGARMKPLRDFFILIFFILLGAQMVLAQVSSLIVPALVLSLFVLVGNPIIVIVLMNLLGYRSRTAFMSGLTVAQISEFSLILVALGYSLGHIGEDAVSLVTLVGIFTIIGSTYLILYADGIYARLGKIIERVVPRKHHHREPVMKQDQPDVIIFGYDRVGQDFVSAAAHVSAHYLVVDYNPESITRLQSNNIPFRYGDAEDVEFLREIGFRGTRLIVSSIPDYGTNALLVQYYRKENPDGIIIVLAHTVPDAKALYLAGASYVVMPHFLGAHHAALLIARHGFDVRGFEQERNIHLMKITKRERART